MDEDFDTSHDLYYMSLAKQVETGANCKGSRVGAVVVLKSRVVSTGYNGTPDDFTNCLDDGCVRCNDSQHKKDGHPEMMSDLAHTSGKALDVCICVHAEQNAFLSAARTGVVLIGATLYTTWSPCFSCLKEALQIGIVRIVYRSTYGTYENVKLEEQYQQLVDHLCKGDETRKAFMQFTEDLACWNSRVEDRKLIKS